MTPAIHFLKMSFDKPANDEGICVLSARDKEPDRLFESVYEDKVSGILSPERFSQLSSRYEDEQKETRGKISRMEDELSELEGKSLKTEDFVSMAKQSREIKRLTPKLLHQFVDWIEIHQAVKVEGVYR